MTGLTNALQAADEWQVKRVSVATALEAYGGGSGMEKQETQKIPPD
jgi:hypothetical protein